jgi:hypothetical protein
VGNRDDLEIFVSFTIDHEEREATHRYASHDPASSNLRHSTDPRVFLNQMKNNRDLAPEFVAETDALFFVANDGAAKLGFGFRLETDRLHLPKISLSIRRRTSAQSEVTASQESRAAHRRSISAAQAASTLASTSESRLWISLAAISARSLSGS